MYSPGDEFEYEIDGIIEDFVCIETLTYNDKDYLLAENEYGLKKFFMYDIIEEELELVEEDEEEELFEIYENGNFDEINDQNYWEENYDEEENSDYDYNEDLEDNFIIEEDEEKNYKRDNSIDEDFLLSLFDDE